MKVNVILACFEWMIFNVVGDLLPYLLSRAFPILHTLHSVEIDTEYDFSLGYACTSLFSWASDLPALVSRLHSNK